MLYTAFSRNSHNSIGPPRGKPAKASFSSSWLSLENYSLQPLDWNEYLLCKRCGPIVASSTWIFLHNCFINRTYFQWRAVRAGSAYTPITVGDASVAYRGVNSTPLHVIASISTNLSASSRTVRWGAKQAIAHTRISTPMKNCFPRMSHTPWFGRACKKIFR